MSADAEIPGPPLAATKVHRALGDPSRVRILAALRSVQSPLDASQLSEQVGLHANTVRSHLHVLAEAHLVSARPEERHQRGRPRVVYTATAEGATAEQSAGYRLLAEILASHLASSGPSELGQAEQAGRAWGRHAVGERALFEPAPAADPVTSVVGLLEELGFAPRVEPAEQGANVRMEHCPFGDMADSYRRIVCTVHLGMMQGALAELGAGFEADSLEPFAEPGVCVAHLGELSTRA